MLTGQYQLTLDEKNRIIIPSRLRLALGGQSLIITAGIDTCLWIFMPNDWDNLLHKIGDGISPFSRKGRLLQRRIIAPAHHVDIDKMGRCLIPQSLQDTAQLKKDCILHGLKRYMELWDVEEYEAYLKNSEEEFQEAAEHLGGDILLN